MESANKEASLEFGKRFGGIARLYSVENLRKIQSARVAVVGLGGVGSWIVEALARTGVGQITLMDLDDICESNLNRQIQGLQNTIGKAKVTILAERIQQINPECQVEELHHFYTARQSNLFWDTQWDCVADAIDSIDNKCHLLASSVRKTVPVVTVGGAGGKVDPSQVTIKDLNHTHGDKLIRQVRKKLRKEYQFPNSRSTKYNIPCIFSPEPPRYPQSDGSLCKSPNNSEGLSLNCSGGLGSATHITGTFGFFATYKMIETIVQK